MSQRSRFLIDPQVQWALVRRMLMHWALAVLALVLIGVTVQLIYAPGDQTLTGALSRSFSAQVPLLCVMFMLMPVYIWDVVRLSHRFVGPMSRLRGALQDLADGQPVERLQFRSHDFWQDTAEQFNRVSQRIGHLETSHASPTQPADAVPNAAAEVPPRQPAPSQLGSV